jgi:hypothetical protein
MMYMQLDVLLWVTNSRFSCSVLLVLDTSHSLKSLQLLAIVGPSYIICSACMLVKKVTLSADEHLIYSSGSFRWFIPLYCPGWSSFTSLQMMTLWGSGQWSLILITSKWPCSWSNEKMTLLMINWSFMDHEQWSLHATAWLCSWSRSWLFYMCHKLNGKNTILHDDG